MDGRTEYSLFHFFHLGIIKCSAVVHEPSAIHIAQSRPVNRLEPTMAWRDKVRCPIVEPETFLWTRQFWSLYCVEIRLSERVADYSL